MDAMSETRGEAHGDGDVGTLMQAIGTRARAAARRLARAPESGKNAALAAMAENLRKAAPEILARNAEDVALAREAGQNAAYLDRLSLDAARIGAIAAGGRGDCGLARPRGTDTGWLREAERPENRACRHPARGDRRDLREPPQCDGGCRGPVPEGGQCRDPARGFGFARHGHGDGAGHARRAGRGGPAGRCRPDRAHP